MIIYAHVLLYMCIYIYIRVSMSKPFWISPTFRQNQQWHRYFRPHLAAPSSSRDHSWKLHRKPFLADNLWWFYAVYASKHSGVLQKVYANSLRYLKPEWISKTHTKKKHRSTNSLRVREISVWFGRLAIPISVVKSRPPPSKVPQVV